MLDIGPLLVESARVLRKNYILAIPAAMAVLAVSFVSLAVIRGPEDVGGVIAMGVLSMTLSLFAHGVTVAMAREAIETGSTTFSTAGFIAARLAGTLIAASAMVGALVSLGSMLFVLPGLAAAFFLMFVFPSMMVDSLGAVEAIKRSAMVARANIKDSAVVFGAVMAIGLIISMANILIGTVPVVGQFLAVALSGAFGGFVSVFMVMAYKALAKRAEAPEGAA